MDRYFEIGHRFRLAGIDGEYEVKEIFGKGASCIVYRTTFTNKNGFKTEHLLKEYNPSHLHVSRDEKGYLSVSKEELPAFADGMKRFEEGYRLQADMRRKIREITNSTSNVQEAFSDFGTQYIDMALLNGEAYSTLRENSLFDLLCRAKAITQVIGSYHKAGYLHLDIKPGNIFTIPETRSLVLFFDFDSVTKKTQVLQNSVLSYTQSWAAPEQRNLMQKTKICEATDLYAIGELVFWQIFGRHSADEEHWSFCVYDFAVDTPFFQNVNPKVFPLLTELFHKTLCVSVKERYQSADELLEKLDQLIGLADPKEAYLIPKAITPNAFFTGRDREINDIHERLQENPKLFLSGIGGIGKSELAKNYAIRCKDSYDAAVFVTYNGSWMMLIDDDSAIQIAHFEKYVGEKKSEYCIRKLQKLAELCDERTLFIIDNLNEDEFADEEQDIWKRILNLNCKFIFTTRKKEWSYPLLEVGVLEQRHSLAELFRHYCVIRDGWQGDVDAIIDYVEGHTLTVELIARQIQVNFSTPARMLAQLKEHGIAQSGREKVTASKDNRTRRRTVFDHICAIFDLAELHEQGKYVMANMTVVPADGLEAELFGRWCGLEDFEAVSELINSGWLNREGDTIRVHPVVAEVVKSNYLADHLDCLDTIFNNVITVMMGGEDTKCVHDFVRQIAEMNKATRILFNLAQVSYMEHMRERKPFLQVQTNPIVQ